MADEHQRVETRASISGTGMKTDPESIRDLQHDAERMERTWKEAPQEDFLHVLERTDAKGELVEEDASASQKGKRSEAHLRTPDPRMQALHARFGSIPPAPPVLPRSVSTVSSSDAAQQIEKSANPGVSSRSPEEKPGTMASKEAVKAAQVIPLTAAPRGDTQLLRFLAEAEDALGQVSTSSPSHKTPPVSGEKSRPQQESIRDAASSSTKQRDASSATGSSSLRIGSPSASRKPISSAKKKSNLDDKRRLAKDAEAKNTEAKNTEAKASRTTPKSPKVRAGPAAISLPETVPLSEQPLSNQPLSNQPLSKQNAVRKKKKSPVPSSNRIRTRHKNVRPIDDTTKGRK